VKHEIYRLDTEFIERPYTIDLISVGLVAEDGREFYAESSEVDRTTASQWTLQSAGSSSTTSTRFSEDISPLTTESRSAGCWAT
jgi:3' exoribonuclease, RNase T-like